MNLFLSLQPDFMTLNTPAVTSCGNYSAVNQPTYMNGMMDDISSSESSYMSMQPPSYYSHIDYTTPAVPSHIPVPTSLSENRGPVIMASTTPEQKPRRKGGRKPKNDPVSIFSLVIHSALVTSCLRLDF